MEIVELDHVEIVLDERWTWKFATQQRDEIDRYFATLRRERPALWNGRVLLLSRYTIDAKVLRGLCFETDYASFIAWRDWGCLDNTVHNFFAAAALKAADGAYLVGEMAPHTACAGQRYFPCGNPEPIDLDERCVVALQRNLGRELLEETGIGINELDAEPGWKMIRDGGFIALLKQLTAQQNADALRSRILRQLATDPQPEFSDIRIIRGPADLTPQMPRHISFYLESAWNASS
jgi:hypothetical protein